ncbi:Uncharacterised protein [Mycobacteroides abscessus]|nr:Uncharacterised protein [Mycobacteroides abscessus]
MTPSTQKVMPEPSSVPTTWCHAPSLYEAAVVISRTIPGWTPNVRRPELFM